MQRPNAELGEGADEAQLSFCALPLGAGVRVSLGVALGIGQVVAGPLCKGGWLASTRSFRYNRKSGVAWPNRHASLVSIGCLSCQAEVRGRRGV